MSHLPENASSPPPATALAPRAAALTWLKQGRAVALATVIETWGSAPVRPGGQMAIASEDEFQGSVSGGCVEADVIAAALDVIATGTPQTLSFGIADETAWRSGLACGGKIRVHVVRLEPGDGLAFLSHVQHAAAARTPLLIATTLATGVRTILSSSDPMTAEQSGALDLGRSQIGHDAAGGEIFLHAITPAPRVIIVGATHIAQHLAHMAAAAGYDVKVLDPRAAFTSPARFSPEAVISGWPEDAFKALADDAFAAIVTLTHVDAIDDEALGIALRLNCRYIGALGARKTHAKRVARLTAAGFADADIARIHAPIGLDIGAETPGEIAVSILAEIIAAFHGKASAP